MNHSDTTMNMSRTLSTLGYLQLRLLHIKYQCKWQIDLQYQVEENKETQR
jgi:hypothetical protein